jgi:hypothetical protein
MSSTEMRGNEIMRRKEEGQEKRLMGDSGRLISPAVKSKPG